MPTKAYGQVLADVGLQSLCRGRAMRLCIDLGLVILPIICPLVYGVDLNGRSSPKDEGISARAGT